MKITPIYPIPVLDTDGVLFCLLPNLEYTVSDVRSKKNGYTYFTLHDEISCKTTTNCWVIENL
jgi:hypothetical protein